MNTSLSRRDVADVLSRRTGIPKEKILTSQQEKILKLESFLKSRIYGQDQALSEIAQTLMSAYAGLGDTTRPLGSFLLKGPSGVGKTETAKALSEFFFDTQDKMIRIDLSEYSEKHAVAKLLGAPSGYVGYEEGGILTQAVRKRPYAVILFDEVEKAHPDFCDILLQILDDGYLTDNKGRRVSFRNTCIILTTNSPYVEKEMKPEVLGRLDGVLYYHLDESIFKRLIQREVAALNHSLKGKNIEVVLSESVIRKLLGQAFDKDYGARPLRNTFQKIVVRPLARRILSENLSNTKIHYQHSDSTQGEVELLCEPHKIAS